MKLLVSLLLCSALLAQEPSREDEGVIRGLVRDSSGTPIEEARVLLNGPGRAQAKTGPDGLYEFRDLAPGLYRLSVYSRLGHNQRTLTLGPGQELAADVSVELNAEVRGRVVDDNGEPMPGVRVTLVGREYRHGNVRDTFRSLAETDDLGEFRLERARPGVRYAIRAKLKPDSLDAVSDAPSDPEARRPAFQPTFYPSSEDLAGAERLIFGGGEVHEDLEIRMKRTPSYCISGVTQTVGASSAAMFHLEPRWPVSGAYGAGSTYITNPQRKTGADGRFRVCDLAPGEYRISVFSPAEGDYSHHGHVDVAVVDRDVDEVVAVASPAYELPGEVAWAGDSPADPVEDKLLISLAATSRSNYGGERRGRDARSDIPGEFVLPAVWLSEYELRRLRPPKGIYVSDIQYGGRSILHGALEFGSAPDGARLRILLSRDAGYATFSVLDEDGDPVPDAYVYLIPEGVLLPGDVAARMIELRGDQYGVCSSNEQPPGVYQVVAMRKQILPEPEDIARLNAARPTAPEVEIVPRETVELKVRLR